MTASQVDFPFTSTNYIKEFYLFFFSLDYCDINHLPEDEFYSTLDTLRTTCRELKVTQNDDCLLEPSSSSSSGLTMNSPNNKYTSNKGKKSKKKKPLGATKTKPKAITSFSSVNMAKETKLSYSSASSSNSFTSNIMPQKKKNQRYLKINYIIKIIYCLFFAV